jgi:hypothetical protein
MSLPVRDEDLAEQRAECERLRALPHDELLRLHRQLLGPMEDAADCADRVQGSEGP